MKKELLELFEVFVSEHVDGEFRLGILRNGLFKGCTTGVVSVESDGIVDVEVAFSGRHVFLGHEIPVSLLGAPSEFWVLSGTPIFIEVNDPRGDRTADRWFLAKEVFRYFPELKSEDVEKKKPCWVKKKVARPKPSSFKAKPSQKSPQSIGEAWSPGEGAVEAPLPLELIESLTGEKQITLEDRFRKYR